MEAQGVRLRVDTPARSRARCNPLHAPSWGTRQKGPPALLLRREQDREGRDVSGASSPHSELADIIRSEVGLIATSEGSTPALDARSIGRIEAALSGLIEQYAIAEKAADFAEATANEWRRELERTKEQLESARNALYIIATQTYPAKFLGVDANGVSIYGGSDDASRFAREVLASNPAKEQV